MTRLPVLGGDEGEWGQVLNDFLSVEHNANGSLKKASDILAAQSAANAAQTAAEQAEELAGDAANDAQGAHNAATSATNKVAGALGVVVYLSNAWPARPSGYGQVLWIGPNGSEPTSSMQTNDIFIANT